MSKVIIDAKISNFIHRKIATMGEAFARKPKDSKSGIHYEALTIPTSTRRAQ